MLIALLRCRKFGDGFMGRGQVLGEEFAEGGIVAAAGGEPSDKIAEVFLGINSVVPGADEKAQ